VILMADFPDFALIVPGLATERRLLADGLSIAAAIWYRAGRQ
jgi:hypothetical protein